MLDILSIKVLKDLNKLQYSILMSYKMSHKNPHVATHVVSLLKNKLENICIMRVIDKNIHIHWHDLTYI